MLNETKESDNQYLLWQISRKLYSLGFLIENLSDESSKPSEGEPIFEGLGMIITELGEQAANIADFMDASIAQRGKRK